MSYTYTILCPKMSDIPGLYCKQDILSINEEAAIVTAIQAQPWDTTLSRRVQQYGHPYNYKSEDRAVQAVPIWAFQLLDTCRLHMPIPHVPSDSIQVIVNEYTPGQGIAPHIDSLSQFAEWILTVSLGSPATMVFTKDTEKHQVTLERRSAYLMTGDARYKWKHSIPARKGDRTGTRISVTFRQQKI